MVSDTEAPQHEKLKVKLVTRYFEEKMQTP